MAAWDSTDITVTLTSNAQTVKVLSGDIKALAAVGGVATSSVVLAKSTLNNSQPPILTGAFSPDATITAPKGSTFISTSATPTIAGTWVNTDGAKAWSRVQYTA